MEIQVEVNAENSPLSKRENEVFGKMALGGSRVQIGEELFICKSTVDSHFNHILQKLDAFNSKNAIAIGIVLDILSFKKLAIYCVICSSISGLVSPSSAYAGGSDLEPSSQRHVRGRVGNRINRTFGRCRSNRKEGLDFE